MPVKIIATLGPSTKSKESLLELKNRGVDFARVNMSHSVLEDFQRFVETAKAAGLPFILDTQGSQTRVGRVSDNRIFLKKDSILELRGENFIGGEKALTLLPEGALGQLKNGDILDVDFHTAILKVIDVAQAGSGRVAARVAVEGFVGSNKATVVFPVDGRSLQLPVLTKTDHDAIALGLKNDIRHIAVSYVRRGGDIDYVREITRGKMAIISKVECREALENLEEIIEKSDMILVDRGDLGKEIPFEKVPLARKVILAEARKRGKPVIVATNLLESMVHNPFPTRAEINDVIACVLDGAAGLTLASETAIGSRPHDVVRTLRKLIAAADHHKPPHSIENHRRYLLDKNL